MDRKFEMAIHGVEPQAEQQEQADMNLDDDQKKAMEIALKKAQERKRLEFSSRNKG